MMQTAFGTGIDRLLAPKKLAHFSSSVLEALLLHVFPWLINPKEASNHEYYLDCIHPNGEIYANNAAYRRLLSSDHLPSC